MGTCVDGNNSALLAESRSQGVPKMSDNILMPLPRGGAAEGSLLDPGLALATALGVLNGGWETVVHWC